MIHKSVACLMNHVDKAWKLIDKVFLANCICHAFCLDSVIQEPITPQFHKMIISNPFGIRFWCFVQSQQFAYHMLLIRIIETLIRTLETLIRNWKTTTNNLHPYQDFILSYWVYIIVFTLKVTDAYNKILKFLIIP